MGSAYAISQSAPFKWKPGEELAACGFVAVVIYLFVDVNICIYRVFKKKRGLYYWSMVIGTWGCLLTAVGFILKYFAHDLHHLWILYTALAMIGWTMFAPAQLLVLYSRLHLVNQNRKLQRWILIMIIIVSTVIIIPSWVLDWPAWNIRNPRLSAIYSPREAILDRCTQFGYTFAEGVISAVYIQSLAQLLKLKTSVKQRRVMIDLIYVNVIVVCLDILTITLVYLNQIGISHPIQIFGYMMKFKLEFLVLNQLMAVAVRSVRRQSFAERRYHQSLTLPVSKGSPSIGKHFSSIRQQPSLRSSVQQLEVPEPILLQVRSVSESSSLQAVREQGDRGKWPLSAKFKKPGNKKSNHDHNDEDGEIGMHRWGDSGKLEVEFPWFRADTSA